MVPPGSGASRNVAPSTSIATTVSPEAARRRAMARPMPCAAPVTIATPSMKAKHYFARAGPRQRRSERSTGRW